METMIALLVLIFAIIVFGASFPAASQTQLRARNTDVATNACQQQLEFWRGVGYASLPAFPNGKTQITDTFAAPEALAGGKGSITFTRLDSAFDPTHGDSGRVRADATITWTGRGMDHANVTVTTLILR